MLTCHHSMFFGLLLRYLLICCHIPVIACRTSKCSHRRRSVPRPSWSSHAAVQECCCAQMWQPGDSTFQGCQSSSNLTLQGSPLSKPFAACLLPTPKLLAYLACVPDAVSFLQCRSAWPVTGYAACLHCLCYKQLPGRFSLAQHCAA